MRVKGLDITSELLTKKVLSDRIEYRVSVTVNFQLYDTYNKRSFTGGETVDHILTAEKRRPEVADRKATASVFTSDVALAVSTAPVKLGG